MAHLSRVDATELIREGVRRVFAVRWRADETPELTLCGENGVYSTIAPKDQQYEIKSYSGVQVCEDRRWQLPWHDMRMLTTAPVAKQTWRDLRKMLCGRAGDQRPHQHLVLRCHGCGQRRSTPCDHDALNPGGR